MDHVTAFRRHLEIEKGASARTVEAYRRDLSQFLATSRDQGHLPDEPGDDAWRDLFAKRNAVRDHLALLRRRGRAQATVARQIAAIRAFARYLQLAGVLTAVPETLARGTSAGRGRRLPRDLSEELVEALLEMPDAAKPRGRRDRAILESLYGLGLRLAEVVGLDLADLDFTTERVRVLGKGNKERILPLLGITARRLREHLEGVLEPDVYLSLLDGNLASGDARRPVFEGAGGDASHRERCSSAWPTTPDDWRGCRASRPTP